jgi:hypothetical protein
MVQEDNGTEGYYKQLYLSDNSVSNKRENNFIIYPNPSNDKIYIDYNNTRESDCKVSISDISGRCIYEQIFLTNSRIVTDVQSCAPGIYNICIDYKHKKEYNKIIIIK